VVGKVLVDGFVYIVAEGCNPLEVDTSSLRTEKRNKAAKAGNNQGALCPSDCTVSAVIAELDLHKGVEHVEPPSEFDAQVLIPLSSLLSCRTSFASIAATSNQLLTHTPHWAPCMLAHPNYCPAAGRLIPDAQWIDNIIALSTDINFVAMPPAARVLWNLPMLESPIRIECYVEVWCVATGQVPAIGG